MKEMVGGCCVCADENGWTDNPLIYCDGENCEVAVHQGCYGIQEVPEGEWFCAKCTKASAMMPGSINEATFCCQLCPFDYGALKKTDRNGWAHVICALYIPEVRFGNVHSMEPVILNDVPTDKFNKLCYICNEERPNDAKKGACMSCNKSTCKRSFHVTCAQRKGLLCEEGAISRNVKYCGYCENHLKKAINDPAIKVIPACPPVQRLSKEQDKKKTVLLTSLPLPPPAPRLHMLADPLPIKSNKVNNVLGLGSAINAVSLEERPASGSTVNSGIFVPPPTAFSPPLTTSSRSSVAQDPSPPLTINKNSLSSSGPLIPSTAHLSATTASATPIMANGSTLPPSSETTVGTHCLQQLQIQSAAAAAITQNQIGPSELNGYPAASQLSSFMHEIPARNTTSVASLLPPGAAEYHLNGSGDEEKTVKAVLTAPLTKAKRIRDSKNDMMDKTHKRPRANARPPAVLGSMSSGSSGGTVGKSPSMQRLQNLVAPIVSETVTDFQRDRVADRTAAERRAAAAQSQPSTSTNGGPNVTIPAVVEVHTNSTNSTNHQNNGLTQNAPASTSMQAGTSSNDGVISQNGTSSTSQSNRLNLPSFMEQLLERQWDQGSSLLMANAHFDVAQLLSCLFQLKSENFRLEENLSGLRKRRDHLFALNSRLAEVNTLDVSKRQRSDGLLLQQQIAHHLDPTSIVPKAEVHKQEPLSAPTSVPLPANHSSSLFEDIKAPKATYSRKTPSNIPLTVPLSTAATALTTTTAASSGAPVNSNIQNHRATPSTAGAPMAATPIMTAVTSANELAALSPERAQALLNMYRMPLGCQRCCTTIDDHQLPGPSQSKSILTTFGC
uniref:Zinc finger protein n=1 Tax=Caenorhabditis elegans TaxID=6239 RepID=Q10652_CAEEL|nr:zinc finger protein [Caenorhabditis elegans]prf//2122400A CEZF gene [Caenorhabditis elegans]